MCALQSVRLKQVIDELGYEIVFACEDYEKAKVYCSDVHRPGLQLAGFYGYFDPSRILVFGKMERAFLEPYSTEEKLEKYEMLLSKGTPAVGVCHNEAPPDELLEMAKKYDVTLFKSKDDTSTTIADLIGVLKRELAPSITRHGVLVEIYGLGVLLQGESGVGKSETAIELLKRGHRLVADDAVEIKRVNGETLIGTAPELIRHYVELRGIGIIDVRRLFGFGAVKPYQEIQLVVNLQPWTDGMQYDRMGLNDTFEEILDVQVPSVTIPVKPGRNLAVILEVAAMNARQKKMGYNAALEFTEQLTQNMNEQLKEQED